MTSRVTCRGLFLGISLILAVGCGSTAEEASPAPDAASENPPAAAQPADPASAARLANVRQLLEAGNDPNKADEYGRTAMMMAAFEGHTDIVALFLEFGAEVDRLDGTGRSALMYAASGPFPETVELLASKGADVNRADAAEGWTALMLAAAEGHRSVVEVLLRHGADIGAKDDDGDTAIDHAKTREQPEIAALLEGAS